MQMIDGSRKISFSLTLLLLIVRISTIPASENVKKATQPKQDFSSSSASSTTIDDAKRNTVDVKSSSVAMEPPIEAISKSDSKPSRKPEQKRSSNVGQNSEIKSRCIEFDTRKDATAESLKKSRESGDNSPVHRARQEEYEESLEDEDLEEVDAEEETRRYRPRYRLRASEDEVRRKDLRKRYEDDEEEEEDTYRASKRFGRPNRQGPKVWDQWGKWSSCSVSCGVGKLTRWRHCIGGSCSLGEKEAQLKTCTFAAC
ncbi:uncharacterized protein LOC105700541 [Orussus abietinus]|uniref:uncharacterized protein LOC105700541 n=1 Tax=Orussus abietinus TaxID=222816 RepID=UPI0006255426|nr:uncharacterized protein LOC105700541 [Orussus abietinus]